MNVRQHDRHRFATHARDAHVDLRARHEKVVHLNSLSGLIARRGALVRAFAGGGVPFYIVEDFAQIVSLEGALERDFRGFHANRAHDDFVREQRPRTQGHARAAHTDGVGCLKAWRIAQDQALDLA